MHELPSPGRGDRRGRGGPGQRRAGRCGHRHRAGCGRCCPAARSKSTAAAPSSPASAAGSPTWIPSRWWSRRASSLPGRVLIHYPAGPGPPRHPLGLHPDPGLQDRRRRWPPSTCSAPASARSRSDKDAQPGTRRVGRLRPRRPVPAVRPRPGGCSGAPGHAGRRAPRLADRPPRGGQGRAGPPGPVQGHARRARP